jgi:hypothetical protein
MAESLGSAVMSFGGDDRAFQQAAFRVERSMLSLANTAARSLGNALEQMSAKVRAGEASFAEMFEQAAKGIPLVGGFYELGAALADVAVGGKAATEAIKQQTAALEAHIALVSKVAEAHQKLAQHQRDEAKNLALGLAGKNFGANVSAIFGDADASRATEAQVRQQARDKFKPAFDELEKLQRENDLILQKQSLTIAEGGEFTDKSRLRDAEKNARVLAERGEQLRRDSGAAENEAANRLGGKAFSQVLNLTGGEFVKGFDAATEAVKRFFKTTAGSTFDQAVSSVGSQLKQYLVIADLITRITDSNLGISNFARNAASAIGGVFPGRIHTAPVAPFQARFEGLEQLGRRIQESAGSGGFDANQAKLLKASERTAEAAEKTATNTAKLKGPIGP